MAPSDPLDDLYTDEAPYDKSRLVEIIQDIVQISEESGEPVFQPQYHELSPEGQVISLLLYRHVATELGEIEELPVEAIWLDEFSNGDESEIIDYKSDFDFVDEDEDTGFYIPRHSVEAALDYIESGG